MKNYSDDMDQNWKRRLERQRMQDAIDESNRNDRTERRVMTVIWAIAFALFLIIVAGVVLAVRVSKDVAVSSRGGLTIVWAPPAATPKGDILPLTEPQTHAPRLFFFPRPECQQAYPDERAARNGLLSRGRTRNPNPAQGRHTAC